MTYNELEMILEKKKITKMDFCRQTGISPQILTNAKNRGGHFSGSTMEKMQSFLNNDIVQENSLTETEEELIKAYRNLDEKSKRQLILMLAFLKDQHDKTINTIDF